MVQILSKEVKEKLQGFLTQPVRILVIEDNLLLQEGITAVLKIYFPQAIVRCLKNFQVEDVEEVITRFKPNISTLDGRLDTWKTPHPVYKSFGMNLIPFIVRESPDTIIIALSSQPVNNQWGIDNGAHVAIIKHNLVELAEVLV